MAQFYVPDAILFKLKPEIQFFRNLTLDGPADRLIDRWTKKPSHTVGLVQSGKIWRIKLKKNIHHKFIMYRYLEFLWFESETVGRG